MHPPNSIDLKECLLDSFRLRLRITARCLEDVVCCLKEGLCHLYHRRALADSSALAQSGFRIFLRSRAHRRRAYLRAAARLANDVALGFSPTCWSVILLILCGGGQVLAPRMNGPQVPPLCAWSIVSSVPSCPKLGRLVCSSLCGTHPCT